ncbi:MAG: hypothetical protein ABIG84_08520 [archaeon]
MKCKFCGNKSVKDVCTNCAYLLKEGSNEESLRRMYSDRKTIEIWKKNEMIAKELGDAYYESVIRNYKRDQLKNDSRLNFGYNTFIDGIRTGLDILMPLLDDKMREMVKEKMKDMINTRSNINRVMKSHAED